MGQFALPAMLFGTAVSIQQNQRAARMRQHAERVAQKRADLQTHRERVKQVREARRLRAATTAQQSAVVGSALSSQALGVQSGIQSQLASNLSFLNQQQQASQAISSLNIQASRAQSQAATAGAIAGVSGDIFETKGGWSDLFKDKNSPRNS